MSAMFGHTWVSQYGSSPEGVARETWLAVIGDLSPRQIGSGLDALKSSAMEWPPSAPRFRAMCFPFPSIREVRKEIERRDGTDCDFSAYILRMIDRYQYQQGTISTRERILKEAYTDLKTYVLDGFEIPSQAPRIEGPK